MHKASWLIGVPLVVAGLAGLSAGQGRPAASAVLFEGARLIAGDGRPPIENSAFIVEGAKFTRVGRQGDVQLPAGATRVDLTGKTVIPAFIDIHNHLGWTDQRTNRRHETELHARTRGRSLQRYAYYGVAATLSMGLDRWDVKPTSRTSCAAR